MLPKKRRLSSAEVRDVIARGKSVRGTVLSLKYVVNKGFFRAAVVVPKSVAKRAVDRNRVRRALYRTLANLPPPTTHILSHTMAVFFVRSVPSPLTPALRDDISAILNKIPPAHV
jgi:ribonuclease P protein component